MTSSVFSRLNFFFRESFDLKTSRPFTIPCRIVKFFVLFCSLVMVKFVSLHVFFFLEMSTKQINSDSDSDSVVVAVALNFEESRAYVNFRCFHARNRKNKLNRIMSKKIAVVFLRHRVYFFL